MISAIGGAPKPVQAMVRQTVQMITGGTLEDLAATREAKRGSSVFVTKTPGEIQSVLVPKVKEYLPRLVPGLSPAQTSMVLAAVTEDLIRRESGGAINRSWLNKNGEATDASGRLMTASGPFQYIMATWNSLVRKYALPAKTYTDPLMYRADTFNMTKGSPGDLEASCKVHAVSICETASLFIRNSIPVNEKTLYLAHFAGANSALKMLKAKKVDVAALRLDVNPTGMKIASEAIATLA